MPYLEPSLIVALVARNGGQVILTKQQLVDARLLLIDQAENDRGEIVLTVYDQANAKFPFRPLLND